MKTTPFKTRHPWSRHGFTLAEVLIALAIISILAAMSVAALSSSRGRARQSVCINNMRQLGLAWKMYSDDYDETRPPRVQSLRNSGELRDVDILLCPDDVSRNWGGLIYDQDRQMMSPKTPPETVHYSYIYAFPTAPHIWTRLAESEGGGAGVFACQTHGTRGPVIVPPLPPSIADYEGQVLRLRADGAVVPKRIVWERQTSAGGSTLVASSWRLFSDAPPPFVRR